MHRHSSPWILFFLLAARLGEAFQVGPTSSNDVAPSLGAPSHTASSIEALHFLSCRPLLCVTQKPLLSENECHALADSFRHKNSQHARSAQRTLKSLQKRLDALLLRDDDTVVDPNFLHYEPSNPDEREVSGSTLLPDGLHVDTNNGLHFRYLTALVYLSTSDSYGATTFPLAMPMGNSGTDCDPQVLAAAQSLLDHDIQHTRQSGGNTTETALLEETALCTFRYGHPGVRILPRMGYGCIFASLGRDGRPDPRSWHGGEHVFGLAKQALCFFYEIPPECVTESQGELGAAAHQRYKSIVQLQQQPTTHGSVF